MKLVFITFADHDAEKESKYGEWQKQETKSQEVRTLDGTKEGEIQPIQKPNCKSTRQGDGDITEPFMEKA